MTRLPSIQMMKLRHKESPKAIPGFRRTSVCGIMEPRPHELANSWWGVTCRKCRKKLTTR